MHTIYGGSAFAVNSNFANSRASVCSSCAVLSDMSNYWTPTLYFQSSTGTFASVPMFGGGMHVYYLDRRYSPAEVIVPFPDGLKMLAGTSTSRIYASNSPMAQGILFGCQAQNPLTDTPGFPTQNCATGLRATIVFPSCWGKLNCQKKILVVD